MDTGSLSYKTLKNASYGFLGYAWPILFSIFITPVIVHRLGVVEYGIYVFINTVMAFLALLDLGISTSVVKFIAEYASQNNLIKLKNLLRSANTLYLIIGFVGVLVFVLIGILFLPWFNISYYSQGQALTVFFLAGLVFFINAANSVYTVMPHAMQRFDITTKINLIQLTLFNVSVLVSVLLGFRLTTILGMNLLFAFLATLAYRWYFSRLFYKTPLGFGWDTQEVVKAYRFGFLAAVTNLSVSSLAQLDRLLIPVFLGPAALSYYSLPGNVAQKTAGVVGSLGAVFFPLASSEYGAGNYEKLKHIYRKSFRNLFVLAAAFATAIGTFSYQILLYWLGQDFAERGQGILVILSVTYFFLALYNPLVNFFMGMGKVKAAALFSLLLAAINFILLFILLPRYKIFGAAWAFLASSLLVILVFYWIEKKYFKYEGVVRYYARLFARSGLVSVVFYFFSKFALFPLVTSLFSLLIIGPLSVVIYLLAYKYFGFFEKEDWEIFKSFIKVILKKFHIEKLVNKNG